MHSYCHYYNQKGEYDDVFVFLKYMAKVCGGEGMGGVRCPAWLGVSCELCVLQMLKSDAIDGEAKFRILLAVGSMVSPWSFWQPVHAPIISVGLLVQ